MSFKKINRSVMLWMILFIIVSLASLFGFFFFGINYHNVSSTLKPVYGIFSVILLAVATFSFYSISFIIEKYIKKH